MRDIAQRISANVKSERAFTWFKLISVTGGAQMIIQGIGLVSGILIIRLLPTQQYALYTLANTMLGTMVILADGGISSGVMAQGGKVWKDKQKLGVVLSTGLYLRRKFAVFSLLIAIPLLVYLLRHHGATWLMASLLILALIPAFLTSLSGSLLEIAPKLHQDIVPLQKIGVANSIGRLVLTCITIFTFPWAYIAILASGIPQIWANLQLRKISSKVADWAQLPGAEERAAILHVVKRTLPGSIYYCVSGQITIWIISVFGSTESIAQIGALSRLTMILTVLTLVMSSLIEPRFSRLPHDRKIVINRFLQIQGGLILLSAVILLAVYLFPAPIISILGKQYAGLHSEVLLMAVSSLLALISGSVFKLSSTRGIVPPPLILIPVLIGIQVLFFVFVDYTKITGALLFSIFTYLTAWIFRFTYFFYWISKNFKKNNDTAK